MALTSHRNKTATSALTLLMAANSGLAIAGAREDLARQLFESTSLVNIVRTDTEQAALISDRLPDALPAELRATLRLAIDQNLSYSAMEDAVVKSLADTLDSSSLDSSLRWWASGSGHAISGMESRAYASGVGDSIFATYNPVTAAPHDITSADGAELATRGAFAQFITELLRSTQASRSCLLATVDLAMECSSRAPADSSERDNSPLATVVQATNDGYSRVPSGDLGSYIAYLRSESAQAAVPVMRASLLAAEQHAWDGAVNQASVAIDKYARATFGPKREMTLRQVTADVDVGQELSRAHMTLELMRHAAPADPAVLVQLARVSLGQAADLTTFDVRPSVPRLDARSLEAAQRLLDEALALDPNRTETLMIAGHLAYLKSDFKRSRELEEKAKAIGPDSRWIRVNLGDALWAQGLRTPAPDHRLAQQAADEFEAGLRINGSRGAELKAVHQLGDVYAELGELPKADSFHRRYISMLEGYRRAFALHRYALFLLYFAHDVDASVLAARQAVKLYDFEIGRDFLAQILAIKGEMMHAAGRSRDAAALLAEAKRAQPDLESICPELARHPTAFPGVFGLHAEGLLKDFSGSIGGLTLVNASAYASAEQLEQLLAWGANPNYFDSEEGAPLHVAILGRNVEAVKVLLAHGANPLTPFVDGRTPSQMVEYPPDGFRPELVALVTQATVSRTSATGPVGTPLRAGYRYRLKKPLSGDRFGYDFEAGDQFIFVEDCKYSDSAIACFRVKSERYHNENRDLAIAKAELSSWKNWFEEVGPGGDASAIH